MTPINQLAQICTNNAGDTITISRSLANDIIKMISPGVDPDAHLRGILRRGAGLSPIERSILTTLYNAEGKIVYYADLISVANTQNKTSLWVHVHRLIKKIDPYIVHIYAVRNVGYRLEKRIL